MSAEGRFSTQDHARCPNCGYSLRGVNKADVAPADERDAAMLVCRNWLANLDGASLGAITKGVDRWHLCINRILPAALVGVVGMAFAAGKLTGLPSWSWLVPAILGALALGVMCYLWISGLWAITAIPTAVLPLMLRLRWVSLARFSTIALVAVFVLSVVIEILDPGYQLGYVATCACLVFLLPSVAGNTRVLHGLARLGPDPWQAKKILLGGTWMCLSAAYFILVLWARLIVEQPPAWLAVHAIPAWLSIEGRPTWAGFLDLLALAFVIEAMSKLRSAVHIAGQRHRGSADMNPRPQAAEPGGTPVPAS